MTTPGQQMNAMVTQAYSNVPVMSSPFQQSSAAAAILPTQQNNTQTPPPYSVFSSPSPQQNSLNTPGKASIISSVIYK